MPTQQLAALGQGRAWRRRDPGDHLLVRGADALDLFHRIAASEVRDLAGEEVRPLLFTDDKGRVVDLAQLASRGGELELFCGRGRGPALRSWIERWIITEDVELHTGGPAWDLFGDEARRAAAKLLPADDPAPGGLAAGRQGRLLRPSAPPSAPALLTRSDDDTTAVEDALGPDLVAVDDAAVDAWSVEQARVQPGAALSARANPLELGWKDLVSWTKGCYIGQEVVARLDTYEKVKRRVVRVEGRGLRPLPGAALRESDRRAGEVLLSTGSDEEVSLLALLDKAHGEGARLEWDGGAGTVSTIPAAEAP